MKNKVKRTTVILYNDSLARLFDAKEIDDFIKKHGLNELLENNYIKLKDVKKITNYARWAGFEVKNLNATTIKISYECPTDSGRIKCNAQIESILEQVGAANKFSIVSGKDEAIRMQKIFNFTAASNTLPEKIVKAQETQIVR